MRIADALAWARTRIPASEARLLLGEVLGQSAAWLLAHDRDELDGAQAARFGDWCERRAGGEPVAYLIGRREFYGREFRVAPGVLIPRPETELLVELACKHLAQVGAGRTAPGVAASTAHRPAPGCDHAGASPNEVRSVAMTDAAGARRYAILDLGTGSACIAISIARECPAARVTAVDASAAALAIAEHNARALAADITLVRSDWYQALGDLRFDLIVSNPPYIRADDAHLAQGDLRYEPTSALAAGEDGLDAIRAIIGGAPAHLHPGGALWLEHGYDQAATVRSLLRSAGFDDVASQRDLAGIERISGGRL